MPSEARPKNIISWAALLSLWYVTFITKISPKPRFLSVSCVEQKSSKSPFYHKGSFSKKLLTFIKPTENKTFSIYDPSGIKLLRRLRVDFGHVNENKFRDNFLQYFLKTGVILAHFKEDGNLDEVIASLKSRKISFWKDLHFLWRFLLKYQCPV